MSNTTGFSSLSREDATENIRIWNEFHQSAVPQGKLGILIPGRRIRFIEPSELYTSPLASVVSSLTSLVIRSETVESMDSDVRALYDRSVLLLNVDDDNSGKDVGGAAARTEPHTVTTTTTPRPDSSRQISFVQDDRTVQVLRDVSVRLETLLEERASLIARIEAAEEIIAQQKKQIAQLTDEVQPAHESYVADISFYRNRAETATERLEEAQAILEAEQAKRARIEAEKAKKSKGTQKKTKVRRRKKSSSKSGETEPSLPAMPPRPKVLPAPSLRTLLTGASQRPMPKPATGTGGTEKR